MKQEVIPKPKIEVKEETKVAKESTFVNLNEEFKCTLYFYYQ